MLYESIMYMYFLFNFIDITGNFSSKIKPSKLGLFNLCDLRIFSIKRRQNVTENVHQNMIKYG